MLVDVLYHNKSHRKIDRLRKKRFENRTKIHAQAYKQGIFQNKKTCIDYVFTPIKPQLDEIRTWMNKKELEIREDFEQLNVGDTVLVPYSGSSTNSVHSAYSNYTDYDCIISGIVLKKDKKKRGFNILYKVIDIDEFSYETLTHKGDIVNIGDSINYNMKHFRLIISSDIPYE